MRKIIIYHLIVFGTGALALAAYFLYKILALQGVAGLVGTVLIPVAVVYIVALGIVCAISCILSMAISYGIRKASS